MITAGRNKAGLVTQSQQRIQDSPLDAPAHASCPALPRRVDVSRRGQKRGDSGNCTSEILRCREPAYLASPPHCRLWGSIQRNVGGRRGEADQRRGRPPPAVKDEAASGACRCTASGLRPCQIPHAKKAALSWQNLGRDCQRKLRCRKL